MPSMLVPVRSVAVSRIGFGAALMAAPRLAAGVWVGRRRAARTETAVLGRALGARDAGLGIATLAALGSGDARAIDATLAACALSDGTDAVATVLDRRRLPTGAAAVTIAMAAVATAASLAALAERRLGTR
jgi:hypothetical protein